MPPSTRSSTARWKPFSSGDFGTTHKSSFEADSRRNSVDQSRGIHVNHHYVQLVKRSGVDAAAAVTVLIALGSMVIAVVLGLPLAVGQWKGPHGCAFCATH